MECKVPPSRGGGAVAQGIDLTRMECKDDCFNGEISEGFGIDLTRMECKDIQRDTKRQAYCV